MERQKYFRYIAILWLFLFCFGKLHAQLSPREQVYQAFIYDQMEAWDQVIGELRNRKANLSDEQLVELINYYYGYIGWAIGEGLDKKANIYLGEAVDLTDELIVKYPEMSDLYAYKGAFVGYKIGLNKIKAVFLGPESIKNINHALEIGPNHPQGWIENGNALYYMPKMFGGSKEKALEAYVKAIQLMEKDSEMIKRNWMYLNVLMILGQSYEKIGNLQLAKITYEKVLRIEPEFAYMREELYPSFLKKWESQD